MTHTDLDIWENPEDRVEYGQPPVIMGEPDEEKQDQY